MKKLPDGGNKKRVRGGKSYFNKIYISDNQKNMPPIQRRIGGIKK